MKSFLNDIKISVIATLVLTLVVSGAYPAVLWAIGQGFFSYKANGSLITTKDGKLLGSELLAQSFTSPKYFHPRPSAAGTGYDPTSSGGTNYGPTSQKLMDSVKAAVAQYRTDNGLAADALAPADAVTSSASGLDPHISVKNALLQAPRVARERHLDKDAVLGLVGKYTDHRQLGIFGEDGVNVLKLNLAMDGTIGG